MFGFNFTLQTVIVLIISLGLLFLYLLSYTYWTRKKMNYWQTYEEKFRNYFFSLTLDYAEKAQGHLTADEIIKKIGTRTKDYIFFLRLLEDLNEILEGKERQRLNHLIEHPLFLSYYKKKLTAYSKDDKIYACLYFQYTGIIDNRTLAHLVVTSKSADTKISYAATKALQSAPTLITHKNALIRFFKRDDISGLMVVELLHNFDSNIVEEHPKIAEALKEILIKDVSGISKSMIVRYLGYSSYYEISTFLCQYLKRMQYSRQKAMLIRSLIIALGQLQEKEAASYISQYLSQKHIDVSTRLAAVRALCKIGRKGDLNFLLKDLLYEEFPIRKAIIDELALQGKEGIRLLDQFVIANLNYIKQLKKQEEISVQIRASVEKIKHTALGINIVLRQ